MRSWVSRRRVPFIKVGRLVRFRIRDLDRFLDDGTIDPVKTRTEHPDPAGQPSATSHEAHTGAAAGPVPDPWDGADLVTRRLATTGLARLQEQLWELEKRLDERFLRLEERQQ